MFRSLDRLKLFGTYLDRLWLGQAGEDFGQVNTDMDTLQKMEQVFCVQMVGDMFQGLCGCLY